MNDGSLITHLRFLVINLCMHYIFCVKILKLSFLQIKYIIYYNGMEYKNDKMSSISHAEAINPSGFLVRFSKVYT